MLSSLEANPRIADFRSQNGRLFFASGSKSRVTSVSCCPHEVYEILARDFERQSHAKSRQSHAKSRQSDVKVTVKSKQGWGTAERGSRSKVGSAGFDVPSSSTACTLPNKSPWIEFGKKSRFGVD